AGPTCCPGASEALLDLSDDGAPSGRNVERSRRSRLLFVRTGSELLDLAPQAPLSIALVARPARACVLVPSVEGVPWAATVEHALAAETGIWGGTGNLIIPSGWEFADDEIFWGIIDLFDPDIVALQTFTYGEVREVAPDQHA